MFTRALTVSERKFLDGYFGSALCLDHISLSVARGPRSWSPYGSHIRMSHTLLGPEREVRLSDPVAASVFAHEAVHVWQRRRGRPVSRHGALLQTLRTLRLYDPYAYDRSISEPETLLALFQAGNIEQQGQIFQDYVRAELTGRSVSRFSAIATFVRSPLHSVRGV